MGQVIAKPLRLAIGRLVLGGSYDDAARVLIRLGQTRALVGLSLPVRDRRWTQVARLRLAIRVRTVDRWDLSRAAAG